MDETTGLTNGTRAITVGAMGAEATAALWDLRWMIVLIVVLILADFWFGVSDSKKKGTVFHWSRAWRRTCNKLVDYVTYLIVGALIGIGLTEPWGLCTHTQTAAIGISLACIIEVYSIGGHVCSLHDIEPKNVRRGVRRFFISFAKRKDADIGEALEDAIGEDGKPHGERADERADGVTDKD